MRFYSMPVPEHEEVPLADDGEWERLVNEWRTRSHAPQTQPENGNTVYVLSVGRVSDPLIRQAQLNEITELVRAQGDTVAGHEIRMLTKPHPRTLLGKGTCREVAARARACGATMLVLDAELSPSQMRNLEDLAGMPVCDREGVILNVFLKHASTRRSRVQVEIARLEYLRPRIRGVGIDMDQQMGGVAGSRGPGETASELLARQLDGRLAELKKAQLKFQKSELQQRQGRGHCRRIALVGYTNAGKTSLMNALTAESLSARQRPFETLDTTSRSLSRHGQRVLLSDTVGFIRRLPERLLASFESTLAEIREASLLTLVVDVSDYEWQSHLEITRQMLERLGADSIDRFYVFNKADLLDEVPWALLSKASQGHPFRLLSSQDPAAVKEFKEELLSIVRKALDTRTLFVPYSAAAIMARIYRDCRVLQSQPTARGLRLNLQAETRILKQLKEDLKCSKLPD
ncbi:MAG: GTPase HflX [Candidatus Eremiobacteraeota bacterium]|nr:GTPase HflX [Candidatus Eremiobacteraeota bacterium]MCW5868609.1 GTPase HflX [Candidatus Eremiobacteraeota bacterium]